MSKFKLADVICWANEQGEILCPQCIQKEFRGHYPLNWTPIFSQDDEEAIYECDTCEKRYVN